MKSKKLIIRYLILGIIFIFSLFTGYTLARIIYLEKNNYKSEENLHTYQNTKVPALRTPPSIEEEKTSKFTEPTALTSFTPSDSEKTDNPPEEYFEEDANKGLIKVILTDVRRYPDFYSERVSEAVMGEEVKIIEEEEKWFKIELVNQYNYPGWVKKEAVKKGGKYHPGWQKVVVKERKAYIYQENNTESHPLTPVLMGSMLEFTGKKGKNFLMVILPDERIGWIPENSVSIISADRKNAEDIIFTAEKLKGTTYLWGGMSGNGIDCSGYVHMIYRANGIAIHRDADLQFYYDGVEVSPDNLQPGDLLFFKNHGEISHVGMYTGNGQFIHSSSGEGSVSLSYLDSDYYSSHYAGAKRILNNNGGNIYEQ